MLSGTLPGSDVAAFQGLLAAAALSGHHDDAPLLEALLERPRTLKIMPTAAGVSAVAYTPDGRRFAAALANGTVRQWNSDRTPIATPLDVPATPAADYSAVAYDPDGSRLVVGRRDGRVLLFDADSGARLLPEMYGHRGTVVGVAVSRDRIVSAGADRTVRVWNARTGRQVADIDTGSQVFGLAVDPAGRFIASAGADGVVRLWDFDAHRLTREFKVPNGSAMSVAISAAGPGGAGRIAAGDARGVVRMWSLAPGPGGPVVDFAGHTDAVMSLAFDPAGDRLVSGGVDQTVRLWNVGAGRPIGDPMTGHHDTVWGVAFSPDGHTVVSGAGIDDKSIRIWNADTPQPVSRPVVGNGERFTGAAFSPDGGAVVSGGSDHAVRMWDTDTGQPLGDPALLPGVVNATAFSPAGDRVGAGSADGTVGIWPVVHSPDGSPGLGTQPALLHTDAVQSAGKIPIDVEDLQVDLLSLASHKLYGPKGIGALSVRSGVKLAPLVYGGGRDQGLRPGTENISAIVGFGQACSVAARDLQRNLLSIKDLRDTLESMILERIPGAVVNGAPGMRLPHILSVTFEGLEAESIVINLDAAGIHASAGAACTSSSMTASHVLTAMGIPEHKAFGTLRLSLGFENTADEMMRTVEVLEQTVKDLKTFYANAPEALAVFVFARDHQAAKAAGLLREQGLAAVLAATPGHLRSEGISLHCLLVEIHAKETAAAALKRADIEADGVHEIRGISKPLLGKTMQARAQDFWDSLAPEGGDRNDRPA